MLPVHRATRPPEELCCVPCSLLDFAIRPRSSSTWSQLAQESATVYKKAPPGKSWPRRRSGIDRAAATTGGKLLSSGTTMGR